MKFKKVAVASGVVLLVIAVIWSISLSIGSKNPINPHNHIEESKAHTEALRKPNPEKVVLERKQEERPQTESPQPSRPQPNQEPSAPRPAPAPAPAPQPKPEEPKRMEFTDKPVQPGNPESYRNTYGQCPFYENAGEKGCVPPPNVKCNADWSKCEPINN